MEKGWYLIIDVAKCENCNSCVVVTKDEYIGNNFPGYSAPQPKHGHNWIRIQRKVRGSAPMVDAAYLPTTCNHCDDAPCVRAGGGKAVVKREDGIVIVDPVHAKGRRDLVAACPYDAIWWNEELELPQIWSFDAHLLDAGWTQPRCVQSCPTQAMQSLKANPEEIAETARVDRLQVLQPELGTRPRVLYKNLHRFTAAFVGGKAVVEEAGIRECVSGASALLKKNGKELARTETDVFGEFKFDGLVCDSGVYTVELAHARYGRARVEACLGDSRYLGAIELLPITHRVTGAEGQPQRQLS